MAMVRNAAAKPAVDETAKVEAMAPAVETAKAEAPAPKAEKPATAPAVVAPKQNVPAVATGGKPVLALANLQDQYIAGFGVLPRLKGSNGNVMDNEDKLLGDSIDMQVLSWNKMWVVGPGDNKAPADLVRYSLDPICFEDGSLVTGYVDEMKEAGWVNASSKQYLEVVGFLLKAAKPTDLIGEMVQIQLSPTSRTSFEGYCLQQSFKAANGMADPEKAQFMRFEAKVVTGKGNTWTKLEAKPTPAE